MQNTIGFLDAVKSKTGAESDYQLAKVLGVTRGGISSYRTGRTFFDDKMAVKVAGVLGIDAGIVLAAAHAERAKSEAERAAWTSIFEKLGGLAAGVVMGFAVASPNPAQASVEGKSVYYVKSRRRLETNPFLQILHPFIPAV